MQVGFSISASDADAAAAKIDLFGHRRGGQRPLVSHHLRGDIHALVMGRLYYGRELAESAGIAWSSELAENDAALVAAVYDKLGPEGLERLEGDHAVAVWDASRRTLTATRDVMGGFPLYWTCGPSGFAVATGLRPLVDHRGSSDIDIDYLGEFQTLPFAEVDYFDRTPFEGISRLTPGSRLTISAGSGEARITEYWNWADQIQDPGSERVEDLAEGYHDLVRAAVGQRLGGTVASHFSGGMDSTAIALLAHDQLAADGRPLHAISLVYEELSNLASETPYLEEALDRPGIVPHRLNADHLLDFDSFRDTPLHDEPYSGLFRAGALTALTQEAAAAGADIVLSGIGADEVLANAPFYIADLVRRGRLIKGWRESKRWSRAHNCSVWRFLGRFGLAPNMPAWSRTGLRTTLRGGYADWKRQSHHTIPPWIDRRFARRAGLRRRILQSIRRESRSEKTVVASEALCRIRNTTGDWLRSAVAAPLGLVASNPFLDPRVLRFGLGARTRIKPVPRLQKVLLNEAMRDVLPESIRKRKSKTHYNSVYYAGLSRNLPHLEAMVRDADIDQYELFDKDRLLTCMNQAALGVGKIEGTMGINNSLAMIKWLELLPAWLDQPLEPAESIRAAAQPGGPAGDAAVTSDRPALA